MMKNHTTAKLMLTIPMMRLGEDPWQSGLQTSKSTPNQMSPKILKKSLTFLISSDQNMLTMIISYYFLISYISFKPQMQPQSSHQHIIWSLHLKITGSIISKIQLNKTQYKRMGVNKVYSSQICEMNHKYQGLSQNSSSTNLCAQVYKQPPTVQLIRTNKENLTSARTAHKNKLIMRINQNGPRKPIFQQKDSSRRLQPPKLGLQCSQSRQFRPISAEVKVLSPKHCNTLVPMEASQEASFEVKSNRSMKKSVRFSEESTQKVEELAVNKYRVGKRGPENKELNRNRSNSILKNKNSSSLTKIELNSGAALKPKENNPSSMFSINEYKNTLVRQRYNQLLKSYSKKKQTDQKYALYRSESQMTLAKNAYTDGNFLMVDSSVFKNGSKLASTIKWVRVSELFRQSNMKVFRQAESNVISHRQGDSRAKNGFLSVLNVIRSSRNLLYRIFQNVTFSEAGMYMLKIFINHEWKCVIIDDFIPVSQGSANAQTEPLFTRIRQAHQRSEEPLQIWPLLLEKAYASVLGSYQAVHQNNFLHTMTQIIGLPLHKIKLSLQKHNWVDELKLSKEQSIVFGFSKMNTNEINQERQAYRLKSVVDCKQVKSGNELVQLEEIRTKMIIKMSMNHFQQAFEELYTVKVSNLHHFTSTNITFTSRLGKAIKNKQCFSVKGSVHGSSDSVQRLSVHRDKPAIKTFNVKGREQISLLVKKKAQKQFQGGKTEWMRVFVFMKELEGYRWIAGKYDCDSVSLSCVLEPGQYFIVVLPDWSVESPSEMQLCLYSRLNSIQIQNYNDLRPEEMIEKGCSDYAQRFGKMNQVNRFICTYAIVDSESGMIIENINNERRKGKVKIFRCISNLKPSTCALMPFNEEFYHNDQIKPEIELCVDRQQGYSVILMFFAGRDDFFLNTFNFGV